VCVCVCVTRVCERVGGWVERGKRARMRVCWCECVWGVGVQKGGGVLLCGVGTATDSHFWHMWGVPPMVGAVFLQLFMSGDVRVWNEVYASRDPAPPILRDDPRWQRCGVSVRRPRFADLHRVYYRLSHGEIFAVDAEAHAV
jgi:hypothetical protein